MPDRCASRCSTVTSSPMSGRSAPSTERAVVDRRSTPLLIKLTTVAAVSPFVPLAIANRVSTVFGIRRARSARPYHTATVDRDHASESALLGKRVDRLRQGHHPRTLQPDRGRGEACAEAPPGSARGGFSA
jgi:hypothetical protein